MVGVHTVGDAAADATGEGSTQVVHHVVLGLLGRGDSDGLVSGHSLGDDARGEQRVHLLALHLSSRDLHDGACGKNRYRTANWQSDLSGLICFVSRGLPPSTFFCPLLSETRVWGKLGWPFGCL
jgi:hypothetical protein